MAFSFITDGTLNEYHLASYGESAASFEPLIGFSHAYEGNLNATVFSGAGAWADMASGSDIVVVMNSDMSVSCVFAVDYVVGCYLTSDVSVSSGMALQAVINALMRSDVFAGFGIPIFDTEQNDCSVWVVNATSGGSTRYENFGFNSYGEFDGRYFGCKTDGVYLLEGDSDGASPIRASIDLGNDNFGSAMLKSCPNAYIGVSSNGTMFLKVTVEGEEYIYAARDESEQMQVQRFDLGRGIRANYLRFEIYNSDGCDFELDTVEFSIVALSRRI